MNLIVYLLYDISYKLIRVVACGSSAKQSRPRVHRRNRFCPPPTKRYSASTQPLNVLHRIAVRGRHTVFPFRMF